MDSVLATLLILGTPAAAVVGGIVAAILRMLGRQRMLELAQRERIAAIERGVDLNLLPPLPTPIENPSRRKVQGFLLGGLLTLGIGVSLSLTLLLFPHGEAHNAWPIGVTPIILGITLLVCARVVREDREQP